MARKALTNLRTPIIALHSELDEIVGDRSLELLRSRAQARTHILPDSGGIGYLRILQFARDTPGRLDTALSKLSAEGMTSLVIDLRNNPGGLVTALEPVLRANDGAWIGWPGAADEEDVEPFVEDGLSLVPVALRSAASIFHATLPSEPVFHW